MRSYSPKTLTIFWSLVLLLTAGVLNRWVRTSRAVSSRIFTAPEMPLSELPLQLGSFLGHDVPLRSDVMQAAHVDAFLHREYLDSSSGNRFLLYVGYWGRENVGMGHGPEVCYPAVGWSVDSPPREQAISFRAEGHGAPVTMALHRFLRTVPAGVQRCAVGFLADVGGEYKTTSRGVFWHRPSSSPDKDGHFLVHVHVSTFPESDAWSEAESDIIRFMELLLPPLSRCLPKGVR